MEYNPPRKKSQITIISNTIRRTIFTIPCPAFISVPLCIPPHLTPLQRSFLYRNRVSDICSLIDIFSPILKYRIHWFSMFYPKLQFSPPSFLPFRASFPLSDKTRFILNSLVFSTCSGIHKKWALQNS